MRINVATGDLETVYTHYEVDGYGPTLEPPSFWIAPKGDTVAIFQNRTIQNSFPHDGRIDLFAYNVTQGRMEWEVPDIDPDGNSNVRPPLVWEDRLYFATQRNLYCLEAATGKIVWQKFIPWILLSNWLIAEGKLIVKLDLESIVALDPATGDEIWVSGNSGANCSDMVYHDGVVYFTSLGEGKLYAVDVATGEHLWKENPPNQQKGFPDAEFYDGVAIDAEKGLLYTSDGYFAMCIQLPEW